jgi:DNA primase
LHEEFEKSRYLFGLNVAKKHILKHGKAIIVEGQFDTTILHTFGINITVGLLGSALSHDHACLLRRYCSEVYLMFDADDAGKKSMERAMDLAKEKCFHLFDFHFIPVSIPRSKEDTKMDPDLFIRTNGKEALLKILKQSKAEYEMNR